MDKEVREMVNFLCFLFVNLGFLLAYTILRTSGRHILLTIGIAGSGIILSAFWWILHHKVRKELETSFYGTIGYILPILTIIGWVLVIIVATGLVGPIV